MISNAADREVRKSSHVKAQAARRRQDAQAQALAAEDKARARATAWAEFVAEPDTQSLTIAQRIKLFNQRYPHL